MIKPFERGLKPVEPWLKPGGNYYEITILVIQKETLFASCLK
jgi:hypothetical protein